MRRNHTREFKLELCRRIAEGEIAKSQACREHGISNGMMDRWMDQFKTRGEHSFDGRDWRSQYVSASARIEQLEEELRQAKLEAKFLRFVLDEKKSPSGSES